MTARLAAVDETAARTADGERWSRWVNMLDSYTYLAEAVDGPPVVPTVAANDAAAEDEPTADAEFGEVDAAADDAALDDDPARDDEPEPSDDEPDPTSHDGRGEPTGAALF
jgi:hypothetical protein